MITNEFVIYETKSGSKLVKDGILVLENYNSAIPSPDSYFIVMKDNKMGALVENLMSSFR